MKEGLLLVASVSLLGIGLQAKSTEVTYGNTIEPMFRAKCLPCHGKTQVGPFDFSTYKGVTSRIELIRTQLLSKSMPPVWTHSEYGPIAMVEPISDEDSVNFQTWVQKGMPMGDVHPAVPYQPEPVTPGSRNLLFAKPNTKVKAEGVPYWAVQTIVLPKEGGSFDSFKLVPDNPQVLRSATLAIVPMSMKVPSETVGSMDIPGKYLVGSWAPGYRQWRLPKGMTRKFPPNSKLVVQAHYRPSGKAESAGFRIEMFDSKAAKATEPKWVSLEKKPFFLNAGESFVVDLPYEITKETKLISILPEARFYAGKVQLLYAQPDGMEKVVFEDIRWDPYWIGNFSPAKPITFAKGGKLIARFHYNNDENCRINAGKPLVPVKGGPTASDEVCRMHLLVGP